MVRRRQWILAILLVLVLLSGCIGVGRVNESSSPEPDDDSGKLYRGAQAVEMAERNSDLFVHDGYNYIFLEISPDNGTQTHLEVINPQPNTGSEIWYRPSGASINGSILWNDSSVLIHWGNESDTIDNITYPPSDERGYNVSFSNRRTWKLTSYEDALLDVLSSDIESATVAGNRSLGLKYDIALSTSRNRTADLINKLLLSFTGENPYTLDEDAIERSEVNVTVIDHHLGPHGTVPVLEIEVQTNDGNYRLEMRYLDRFA